MAFYEERRPPFTAQHWFRQESEPKQRHFFLHGETEGIDTHVVELPIPNLMDVKSVKVSMVMEGGIWFAVATADVFNQTKKVKLGYSLTNYKVEKFSDAVAVPFTCKNHVPKATLSILRDTCEHVTDGLLRLEWKVRQVEEVVVEVQDCSGVQATGGIVTRNQT